MLPTRLLTIEEVLSRLGEVRQVADYWKARCPAHEDDKPSLKISRGDKGILLKCFAGCSYEAICAAMDVRPEQLFYESMTNGATPAKPVRSGKYAPIIEIYPYYDADGTLLYEVCRDSNKDFPVRRPNPRGGYVWGQGDVPRILYGLPQVLAAMEQRMPIWIVEGEKDVQALAGWGLVATTSPGGAGKWRKEYSDLLQGARCIILPDNDPAGREHVFGGDRILGAAPSLHAAGCRVKVLELSDLPEKGDVSNWMEAGGTAQELVALAKAQPDWEPEKWIAERELEAKQQLAQRVEKIETQGRPGVPVPFTAESLMIEELPEPRWAVPGLLAEGANMLAGRPKLGKSFLAFNLAIAVASGGKALGSIDVEQGEVLYLALEDTKRRLKRRLKTMLKGEPVPRGLYLVTTWPRMGDQLGEAALEAWIVEHPGVRLVIIDTLGRMRGARDKKGQIYDEDYETISKLKAVADKHALCILIVHHVRKSSSDDPLEMVSGSFGITGGLDTVLVLARDRCDRDGSLFVTGRDVDEERYALRFDANLGTWALVGTEEERLKSRERESVLRVLLSTPDPLTPAEVARVLEKGRNGVKRLMWNMAADGEILSIGEGKYCRRTAN